MCLTYMNRMLCCALMLFTENVFDIHESNVVLSTHAVSLKMCLTYMNRMLCCALMLFTEMCLTYMNRMLCCLLMLFTENVFDIHESNLIATQARTKWASQALLQQQLRWSDGRTYMVAAGRTASLPPTAAAP